MIIHKAMLLAALLSISPTALALHIDFPESIEQVLPEGIEVASYVEVWNEMGEARCAKLESNGKEIGTAWGFEAQDSVLIVYPCEFYATGEVFEELKAKGHIPSDVESGGDSSIAHRFRRNEHGDIQFKPLDWPGQSMLSYERVCDKYVAYYQVFGSKVWGAIVDWTSEDVVQRKFLGDGNLGTDFSGALGEPMWSIDCSEVYFPASMPGLVALEVSLPK